MGRGQSKNLGLHLPCEYARLFVEHPVNTVKRRHAIILCFYLFVTRVNIQYTHNLVVTGMSFLDADSALNDDKKNVPKTTVTPYARLLRQSPMTSTISAGRYKSNHRVLGNIVNALINLQKYTVSQKFSL